MILLWVYLGLTLLIAAWLGLVMWRHLDEFDWRHRSDDIWLGFVISLLLWPLFLVTKPALIVRGYAVRDIRNDGVMDLSGNLASRMRQLEDIALHPPPCGSTVLYRCQDSAINGISHINLWFVAADIERHFRGRELPVFWDKEQAALVNFIKGRDDSLTTISEIPHPIDFSRMSLELLQNGYGEIECPICQRRYPIGDMSVEVPQGYGGWSFEVVACQEGHPVLSYRLMHISTRQRDDQRF